MEKLTPGTIIDKRNLRKYTPDMPEQECWMNDIYTVMVVRHQPSGFKNPETGEPCLMTWLSIRRNDRAAKPDWRDFQWMKNQLVGEENEGMELYPAESRLVDGANQFHLWVFEDTGFRIPIGFETRLVSEKSFFGETQRKFPETRKPSDLEASHQFLQEHKDMIDNGQAPKDFYKKLEGELNEHLPEGGGSEILNKLRKQ